MKYHKFIIANLIIIACNTGVFACTYPAYKPTEYMIFDINDPALSISIIKEYDLNIVEWHAMTGYQAIYDDINDVVYNFSIDEMKSAFAASDSQNTFIKYMRDNNDTAVLNYLIIAKRCEYARYQGQDKWWYPSKKDFAELKLILNHSMGYKGSRLKLRYMLQAMRAAFTLKDYTLCVNIWEKHFKKAPKSPIKTLAMGYLGGCYFRINKFEEAMSLFAESGDVQAVQWCANRLSLNETVSFTEIQRMYWLYQYMPRSKELIPLLQKVCRKIETAECDCWGEHADIEKEIVPLRDLALRVASEHRTDNAAVWQYAAAFLTFKAGDDSLAAEYAAAAAKLKCSAFIREKIQILQLIIDAKRADGNDIAERFLPRLQWLDRLILRDQKTMSEPYNDDLTFACYSQLYPFDMMRRVTLGYLVPKLISRNHYTQALLLAGMASERLRQLSGFDHKSPDPDYTYNPDYSTDVFIYMDSLPVKAVINYQHVLQTGGSTPFERFTAARCYHNDDWLNELIGTKFIRQEKFDLAVGYLSKVSDEYIVGMNLFPHLSSDLFRSVYMNGMGYTVHRSPHYKIDAARKLLQMQRNLPDTANSKKAAQAIFDYALALERMASHYDCWALTRYSIGLTSCFVCDDDLKVVMNEWQKNFQKHSQNLLTLLEKCPWQDIKAQRYVLTNPADFSGFVKRFAKSNAAKKYEAECDDFRLYLADN